MSETGKSFIALSRWVSALVVFCAHLRAIMFVGWANLPPHARTIPVLIFYTLTSFFHEAVIAFFVLSGFLVGGVNFRRARQGRFHPFSYAIDRFTRIYVTLVPALLFTIMVDQLGMRYLASTGFYDGSNPVIMERFHAAIQTQESFAAVLGNVAMLQPVYSSVLGSNFPLWSLSYEVWFYVWFGLLAVAVRNPNGVTAALVFAATILLGWFFQWLALYYLTIWCLGLLALEFPYWPRSTAGPLIALALSLALAASSLTQTEIFGISVRLSDFPVGLSFAWLINSVKDKKIPALVGMSKLNHRLSDVSYSLYVIHFPAMLLICGLLAAFLAVGAHLRTGLLPTDWRAISLYLGTVCCVLPLVFLFGWLVERRTGEIRQRLKNRLRPVVAQAQ